MLLTAEQVLDGAPQATVLTIDFFDTLITRSVAQPTHVFALMEQQLVQEHGTTWNGFAVRRVQAEHDARAVAASDDVMRDITIDEIYLAFAQSHGLNMDERTKLIALEKQHELQCVQPVSFGVAITSAARERGMRVVIVSDNYMPSSHIVNMAHGAGYSWVTAEDVFVSCEHGGMKHNGELWNSVIIALGLDVATVLHVGDDEVADDVMPRSFGIATHIRNVMRRSHRQMANTSPAVLPLSRIEAGYRDDYANSEWPAARVLGGGAIALLVAAQIVDVMNVLAAREVRSIHFIARDGYLAHQVWEKLRANGMALPSASYTALSRSVMWRSQLTGINEDIARRLVGDTEELSVDRLARRVGCELETHLAGSDVLDVDSARALLLANGSRIVAASAVLRERFVKYLRSVGMLEPGHHVLVDLGWTGSTIADLSDVIHEESNSAASLEGRLTGMYWDAARHRTRVPLHGFAVNDLSDMQDNIRLLGAQCFFESVMSAPHGSVVGYSVDGEPEFFESLVETSAYREVGEAIAAEAVQSACEIVSGTHASGVTAADITGHVAWAAMMQVGHTPRADEVALMKNVSHITAVDHEGEGENIVVTAPSPQTPHVELVHVYDHLMRTGWVQGSIAQWQQESSVRWIADEMRVLWPALQLQWVKVR